MTGGKNQESNNKNNGEGSVIACLVGCFLLVFFVLLHQKSLASDMHEVIWWRIAAVLESVIGIIVVSWFWLKPKVDADSGKRTDYHAIRTALITLSGCILLIVICIAFAYYFLGERIFTSMDDENKRQFFAFITIPAIVICVSAAVTLFWTAWRSKIQSIQTDEQIEQGKRSTEQLRISNEQLRISAEQLRIIDRNNVAKLLVDAAQMLDDKSPAKQNAALAILKQIGLGEDKEFAIAAVQLIETVLERQTIKKIIKDNFVYWCFVSAAEIHRKHGTISNARLHIKDCTFSKEFPVFVNAIYENCTFFYMNIIFEENLIFDKCHFKYCNIGFFVKVGDFLTFYQCKIFSLGKYYKDEIEDEFSFKFINCDFSGFEYFVYRNKIPTFIERDEFTMSLCYYYKDNPPSKNFLDTISEDDIQKRDPERRDDTVIVGAQ